MIAGDDHQIGDGLVSTALASGSFVRSSSLGAAMVSPYSDPYVAYPAATGRSLMTEKIYSTNAYARTMDATVL
ncbi:MAG: hypothetical protein GY722_05660, partial [bacterium]|nr:hypothetical protein [bacterium]